VRGPKEVLADARKAAAKAATERAKGAVKKLNLIDVLTKPRVVKTTKAGSQSLPEPDTDAEIAEADSHRIEKLFYATVSAAKEFRGVSRNGKFKGGVYVAPLSRLEVPLPSGWPDSSRELFVRGLDLYVKDGDIVNVESSRTGTLLINLPPT
jgi:hypothetical protein